MSPITPITRRAALAAPLAAAAAPAFPRTSAASDAELLRLGRSFDQMAEASRRADAAARQLGGPLAEGASTLAYRRTGAIADAIAADAPPRTMEGFRLLARVALWNQPDESQWENNPAALKLAQALAGWTPSEG